MAQRKNLTRFLAFSVLHLSNYIANVTIVVYLLRPWPQHPKSAVGVGLALSITHILVGLYCTCLAFSDNDIRRWSKNVGGLCGLLLFPLLFGLSQFIQLKVAWCKYMQRQQDQEAVDAHDEGDTMSDDEEDAEVGESSDAHSRIMILDDIAPWSMSSKCFEGMFEGTVFSLGMMAIQNWWIPLIHAMDIPRWVLITCGLLSSLTAGVSVLNFDYYLNFAVQKTVDHSIRYTFFHALFRICETGSRITLFGMWFNVNIDTHRDGTMDCIGNYVLIADYCFCVFFLLVLSAADEFANVTRFAPMTTTKRITQLIICSCLIGLPMLVANLPEFVDKEERRTLRSTSFTFNWFLRCVRFTELLCLVGFCVFQMKTSLAKNGCDTDIFSCIQGGQKIITWLMIMTFVVTNVVYYSLLFAGFHHVAVANQSGVQLRSWLVRALRLPAGAIAEATATGPCTTAGRDVTMHVEATSERAVPLLPGDASGDPSAVNVGRASPQIAHQKVPIIAVADAELPDSLRDADASSAPNTWYYNQTPGVRLKKPRGLSFLLLSNGLNRKVTDMVMPTIFEETNADVQSSGHSDETASFERVKMSDFEILALLGSGSRATVMKCKKRATGEFFAMKRLVKRNYVQRSSVERAMQRRERDTMCFSGRHPHVASLECAFHTDLYWILVLEFCDLGSLAEFIHSSGDPGLDYEVAVRLSGQILQGLAHIHSYEILHRDIKPENIGISSPADLPVAKLIDFGCAKRVTGSQTSTLVGSYGYLAPEISQDLQTCGPLRKATKSYDASVDLYSFGICLFVMHVGHETDPIWTHRQFREMLADEQHPLWYCSTYARLQIFSEFTLPDLDDCGALQTISALTETQPSSRPPTARDAGRLSLFTNSPGCIPPDWLADPTESQILD